MKNYRHILVPIDFSEAAATVIRRARDVSQRNDAKLTLINVVEYMPPPDLAYEGSMMPDWPIDDKALVTVAESTLKSFCKQHRLDEAMQVVLVGTPKYEICQYARAHECDLIIMGAHGLRGIRLLLGSTTNGVMHEMPCDVLAVKTEAHDR